MSCKMITLITSKPLYKKAEAHHVLH